MAISWKDAVAQVTAAGGDFEIVETEVLGRKVDAFKNQQETMKVMFDESRAFGDKEYIIYEGERWTFNRVFEHVDAFGALLVNTYGVKRGDRIALAMRNYPEWIVAYVATVCVGAVIVPMNSWWQTEELHYGLQDCGATVIVADQQRLDRIGADWLATHAGTVKAIVARATGDLPAGVDRYEDAITLGDRLPQIEFGREDDATILYTSGTTGFPKGAVSTHFGVMSALWCYACRRTIDTLRAGGVVAVDPDKACLLLPVPLFHVTGCLAIMLNTFKNGTRIVLMPKWNAEYALELIERERVSQVVGVPTMSWDLVESPDFKKRDTSSLVFVGGGGAPAPPELVRKVNDSFPNGTPTIGYGMTETNAYGPQNRGEDYLTNPTSTGRVGPPVKMRVTDPDGNVLPPGQAGELWFWGPNLIRGYWNRPEATAETIVDGWLRSGDIGVIDENGFVYVQDRAKDMVLRGGENIYCAVVEAAIYEIPAVYEAAVFGVPDHRLGEELACAVYLKPGASLTADELRAELAKHVAAFEVPSVVKFYEQQLPRNASGKILKRQIRDEVLQHLAH